MAVGPAIMGMPDVYAEAFARRVDESAAAQLDSRSRDPWMLGYFIWRMEARQNPEP